MRKEPISNGFKLLRESLGLNKTKMSEYLEISTPVNYSFYESGSSLPRMREFVRISNVAKRKCFDIRYAIYPQFCYKGPIVREQDEWIEAGSFLELREMVGLSKTEMSKLLDNYINDKCCLYWWESGKAELLVNNGLIVDTFARANKIRLSDAIWVKHTNNKVHNERIWGSESGKVSNRRMKIVDQSPSFINSRGRLINMDGVEKFEGKEDRESGDPKSPVDLLRRKLGLTKSQFGNLIYVRGLALLRMLDGEMIPSIHLARVIQEEARKRGLAVTLDEIYQNVVI